MNSNIQFRFDGTLASSFPQVEPLTALVNSESGFFTNAAIGGNTKPETSTGSSNSSYIKTSYIKTGSSTEGVSCNHSGSDNIYSSHNNETMDTCAVSKSNERSDATLGQFPPPPRTGKRTKSSTNSTPTSPSHNEVLTKLSDIESKLDALPQKIVHTAEFQAADIKAKIQHLEETVETNTLAKQNYSEKIIHKRT